MKLIIDIPDGVYKCVMDGTYCGTLYEELKNGVPVDTSGDCINREAAEQPEKRTEERTETHACDCISRETAVDEILREVETLRRDVRELKELLGYIREYGITKDKTPRHIAQRFCEIVDGWEEQDGGGD